MSRECSSCVMVYCSGAHETPVGLLRTCVYRKRTGTRSREKQYSKYYLLVL